MAPARGRREWDKKSYISSWRSGDKVGRPLWQTDEEIGLIGYAVH